MPYYPQRATTTSPRGPWEADHQYEIGDLVTLNGSMWYAASRNINDPPPSRSWWGPFLLGGIPGLGGGHLIQWPQWDGEGYTDQDAPARTYLRFDPIGWEEGAEEFITITDDSGGDQTVVRYITPPVNNQTLQDTIGRGYDLVDIPLNTGAFAHPDPEGDPPVTAKMGMDNFGIVHFQGYVTAVTASPSPGTDLLLTTLPAGLFPVGRNDVRLPIWVDSATPHEPAFLRIQGDGDVYIEIAEAGDVVHLDGVRYVAGLGGRRIARESDEFTPEEPEAFSISSPEGNGLRHTVGYGIVNGKLGRRPFGWQYPEYGFGSEPVIGFVALQRNFGSHAEVGAWGGVDLDTARCGWEIVEGPDAGLTFGPEPFISGYHDYPGGVLGQDYAPTWNPDLYLSDQVVEPPPYPYTSIDARVWVYLRSAPLNPGNVIRVFLDMHVGWGPSPSYYTWDWELGDDAT